MPAFPLCGLAAAASCSIVSVQTPRVSVIMRETVDYRISVQTSSPMSAALLGTPQVLPCYAACTSRACLAGCNTQSRVLMPL